MGNVNSFTNLSEIYQVKAENGEISSKIEDYPHILGPPQAHNVKRNSISGFWIGQETQKLHDSFADHEFAQNLSQFFIKEKSETIIDVGAGAGIYTDAISKTSKIFINCYDGNPNTQAVSGGKCGVLDFTKAVNLPCKYDWVLCLKVGKHIPSQFHETFINNLDSLNKKGIVLCWGGAMTKPSPVSTENQTYFNNLPESEIVSKFTQRGYKQDVKSEELLKSFAAPDSSFRKSAKIFVFRKENKVDS